MSANLDYSREDQETSVTLIAKFGSPENQIVCQHIQLQREHTASFILSFYNKENLGHCTLGCCKIHQHLKKLAPYLLWVWYMSQESSEKKLEFLDENPGSATTFKLYKGFRKNIQRKMCHRTYFALI